MKTIIHHIELSHTSFNLSGGEKALIEIVKYFTNDQDVSQIIYTSESGVITYKKLFGNLASQVDFVRR